MHTNSSTFTMHKATVHSIHPDGRVLLTVPAILGRTSIYLDALPLSTGFEPPSPGDVRLIGVSEDKSEFVWIVSPNAIQFDPSSIGASIGILDTTLDAHLVAADPHTQYLTAAEGDAAYVAAAHLVAADPHTQYLTAAEGDAAYVNVGGDTITGNLKTTNVSNVQLENVGGTAYIRLNDASSNLTVQSAAALSLFAGGNNLAQVIAQQGTYLISSNVRPLKLRYTGAADQGGVIAFEDVNGVELGYIGYPALDDLYIYNSNVGGQVRIQSTADTIIISPTRPTLWAPEAMLTVDSSGNSAGYMYGVQNTFVGASSGLTLTTSAVAVPSCSAAIVLRRAGIALITGTFDMEMSGTGVGALVGELYLNGSLASTPQAIVTPQTVGDRVTVSQTWTVAMATVGATHTFDLRARKTVNGGTALCNASHSTINATFFT